VPSAIANADLAWVTSKAAADEAFAVTDAGNWQSMIDGEASAVDTFAHADDAANQTADDAAGQAQAAQMNAQAAADQAQEDGDASAEADFSEAEANDEASVMSGFAQNMNSPWAQFEAALAAANAAEADAEGGDLVTYEEGKGVRNLYLDLGTPFGYLFCHGKATSSCRRWVRLPCFESRQRANALVRRRKRKAEKVSGTFL
jgi:hypothetical protein